MVKMRRYFKTEFRRNTKCATHRIDINILRNLILIITWMFFSLLILCIAFLDMPRIAKTTGYTSGVSNPSKIVPQTPGLLSSIAVVDQMHVKRGDVLGEMTSERFMNGHSVDAEQALIVEHKLDLDKNELFNIDKFERNSNASLRSKISADRIQILNINQELYLSRQRLNDLDRQMERQHSLIEQGFVSGESVEQKRSELLNQKIAISTLERILQQLEADVIAQQQELEINYSKFQTQRTQIERELSSFHQELNEQRSKRVQLIAPIDGMVTQISVSVGQTIRPDFPVMTIVPLGGSAEVLLLVPSRSIGFIRIGQRVSVRYQAYPYEHYGRHWGTIKEIAQVALPPQEVVQQIKVDEPVYTVRVTLPSNYMEFDGKHLPITPGMLVDADVELDRLKIYQWLLEPLYRLGARV